MKGTQNERFLIYLHGFLLFCPRSSSGFYFATIVNWTKILIGVQWKYEETNIRFTAAQNGFLFRKAARNTGFMCILFMKQLDLLSTNEAF